MFNVKYPKLFQKNSATEAALASMETLEDKLDATNDGMENVKLDMTVSILWMKRLVKFNLRMVQQEMSV